MNVQTDFCPPRNRSQGCRRAGFSLTELLVVIGIIVLLVGLLLVALGGVRTRAKQADTEGIMRAFAQACEAFQMEHRFYPGVVPETAIDQSYGSITTTENALLHLMGGYRVLRPGASPAEQADYDNFSPGSSFEKTIGTTNEYKIKIDLNKLGEGPVIDGKPYAPYFTPAGREFSVVQGQFYLSAPPADQELPDLIDAWGQPVLYVRQQRPTGDLVGDANGTPAPKFAMAGLEGYIGSDGLGELGANQQGVSSNPSGSILAGGSVANNEDNFARLIEHPALAGEPRGAFALFSAGPDGVYFSGTDGPGTPTAEVTVLDSTYPASVIDEYDDVRVFGGG